MEKIGGRCDGTWGCDRVTGWLAHSFAVLLRLRRQ